MLEFIVLSIWLFRTLAQIHIEFCCIVPNICQQYFKWEFMFHSISYLLNRKLYLISLCYWFKLDSYVFILGNYNLLRFGLSCANQSFYFMSHYFHVLTKIIYNFIRILHFIFQVVFFVFNFNRIKNFNNICISSYQFIFNPLF